MILQSRAVCIFVLCCHWHGNARWQARAHQNGNNILPKQRLTVRDTGADPCNVIPVMRYEMVRLDIVWRTGRELSGLVFKFYGFIYCRVVLRVESSHGFNILRRNRKEQNLPRYTPFLSECNVQTRARISLKIMYVKTRDPSKSIMLLLKLNKRL